MSHAHNAPRPYVTASAAMSLDGYLDTASPPRLALSSDADFDRVDEVRAAHDAVFVGAQTVRLDDPRLLVRSEERRQRRIEAGRRPNPTKVTVTGTGDLDPSARFFTAGDAEKVVYCPDRLSERLRHRLPLATVVGLGQDVSVPGLLRDLGERGVASLMVEGGGRVLTQFLTSGLVDELHLVVAPFFVGDHRAPRFVSDAEFPWTPDRRARLIESLPYGDVALLRFGLSDRCDA